jgi:glyoxalase family protein
MQPAGVHHVSSVSAHIRRSRDFYVGVLGLRPVITTVNQDDPTMYHLFFGDGAGSPGSDMTVFDIPYAEPERRGNNSLTLTTFRVSGEDALRYWASRLESEGVKHTGLGERDGRSVLDFDDSEGTPLSLVDDRAAGIAFPWAESPVPAGFQIRGLGYPTLTVPALPPTEKFLQEALGFERDHGYTGATGVETHVYRAGGEGPQAEVAVIVDPGMPRARYGAGGVHHVALRVPAGQTMEGWRERLDTMGYRNSGLVDRHYFTSIYVREPNHVLFELASDWPGFEVDGPIDPDRISLPPFLEPHRAEIEAGLTPL